LPKERQSAEVKDHLFLLFSILLVTCGKDFDTSLNPVYRSAVTMQLDDVSGSSMRHGIGPFEALSEIFLRNGFEVLPLYKPGSCESKGGFAEMIKKSDTTGENGKLQC
jgi:hypothetical protein